MRRTLIVACDLPFCHRHSSSASPRPSDADLVDAPHRRADYEPLCADMVGGLRRRRSGGGFRMGTLKTALVVEELRVEEIGPEVLAAYDPTACCS